jgi:dGTP triphosphohydrolase
MSAATTTVTFVGIVEAAEGIAYIVLDRDDGSAQAILRTKDRELKALEGKQVKVTIEVLP